MTRVGKSYRRGPTTLNEHEIERLVLLADGLEHLLWQRDMRHAKIKNVCDKFILDVRKYIKDELVHVHVGESESWDGSLLSGSGLHVERNENDGRAVLDMKFMVALD